MRQPGVGGKSKMGCAMDDECSGVARTGGPESGAPQPADPIVEAVRTKLLERSQRGLSKYGVALDRTDISYLDWLRHAQEEALDLANYLEVLIQREMLKLDTETVGVISPAPAKP